MSNIEGRYFVNLIKIDRAQPRARRGFSAYASESDTTNPQSTIQNPKLLNNLVG